MRCDPAPRPSLHPQSGSHSRRHGLSQTESIVLRTVEAQYVVDAAAFFKNSLQSRMSLRRSLRGKGHALDAADAASFQLAKVPSLAVHRLEYRSFHLRGVWPTDFVYAKEEFQVPLLLDYADALQRHQH